MIKYAALPVIAVLAACSAEVEDNQAADANGMEALSVNNQVIPDVNAATGDAIQPEPSQPAESAQGTASAPSSGAATEQPTRSTSSKPAATATAKDKVTAAPPAPATTTSNTACTEEHREMGHC